MEEQMSNKKKLKDLTIRDNFMFAAVMMQVETEHLGKRTRYYHSHMDMELLESGSDYELLPGNYVIFICDFDHSEMKNIVIHLRIDVWRIWNLV